MIDKYDTFRACQLAGKAWLRGMCERRTYSNSVPFMNDDDIAKLLTIAHFLKDYHHFAVLSKLLLAYPYGVKAVQRLVPDVTRFPDSFTAMFLL